MQRFWHKYPPAIPRMSTHTSDKNRYINAERVCVRVVYTIITCTFLHMQTYIDTHIMHLHNPIHMHMFCWHTVCVLAFPAV